MTANSLADQLNRHCHCIGVDAVALQASLETRLGGTGAWLRLRESHPYLMADTPVFVARSQVERIREIIADIEAVVATAAYRDQVLQWAPDIARIDHGPRGVFFGYDFHLAEDGPQLIEINTNAGGGLLLLHVASAQQACCPEVENFITGRFDIEHLERAFVDMFRAELHAQYPGRELRRVAIVDEHPDTQFLGPEFELFRRMFEQFGVDARIVGPATFDWEDGVLSVDGQPVDLVYNRLTDFYLESPACAALAQAYRYGGAVITPSPHAHALYANKRNLTLLWQRVAGVPKTELVSADNAQRLWDDRKQLYFKPTRGFGSRGTYRGAKLTRGKWEEILAAEYVAQALVPPSERLLLQDDGDKAMKLDLRCYTYGGEIQLLGARLYRGQATNFRTEGGGLAAVFTAPDP